MLFPNQRRPRPPVVRRVRLHDVERFGGGDQLREAADFVAHVSRVFRAHAELRREHARDLVQNFFGDGQLDLRRESRCRPTAVMLRPWLCGVAAGSAERRLPLAFPDDQDWGYPKRR